MQELSLKSGVGVISDVGVISVEYGTYSTCTPIIGDDHVPFFMQINRMYMYSMVYKYDLHSKACGKGLPVQ